MLISVKPVWVFVTVRILSISIIWLSRLICFTFGIFFITVRNFSILILWFTQLICAISCWMTIGLCLFKVGDFLVFIAKQISLIMISLMRNYLISSVIVLFMYFYVYLSPLIALTQFSSIILQVKLFSLLFSSLTLINLFPY